LWGVRKTTRTTSLPHTKKNRVTEACAPSELLRTSQCDGCAARFLPAPRSSSATQRRRALERVRPPALYLLRTHRRPVGFGGRVGADGERQDANQARERASAARHGCFCCVFVLCGNRVEVVRATTGGWCVHVSDDNTVSRRKQNYSQCRFCCGARASDTSRECKKPLLIRALQKGRPRASTQQLVFSF
jgi:hypothetical protein